MWYYFYKLHVEIIYFNLLRKVYLIMNIKIGEIIKKLRKERDVTQEKLADYLGISYQAVSKWENDISCPDIMLLPKLAGIFNTTVDELLSGEQKPETQFLPEEKRKNPDHLILKIIVNASNGDKIRLNIPIPLIKAGLQMGMQMPQISGNEALKNIDFEAVMNMIDKGLIGKLVEIESDERDSIEIMVE